MKRLVMIIAIAVAANFAAFDIQPASANDAHHPAQTSKSKRVKTHAKGKAKSAKGSRMQMTKCRMMSGSMMHDGMMKCPMMGAGKKHRMKMMHGMSQQMMAPSAMHHGSTMMGRPERCQVMTDRERGFDYHGACAR